MNTCSDYTTPPCTSFQARHPMIGLGFNGFEFPPSPSSSCSSSNAPRSHWSSDSSYSGSGSGSSPLPPSPPASNAALSPPLVPLQTFDCLVDEDEDCDLPPSRVAAPSYRYALENPGFQLLPSLPIFPSQCSPMTPPASPERLRSLEARANVQGRKRKVSFLENEAARETRKSMENENIKRLKTSPAIKHLGIFTRAAFAEEEENQFMKDGEVALEMASMALDPFTRSDPQQSKSSHTQREVSNSSSRRVDFTLLVSNLPAFSPYPPTPRSTVLPPLLFSSTIFSSRSTFSSTFSADFEHEIKADVEQRLGLAKIGLGIKNINLYPAAACEASGSRMAEKGTERMTVVVHTGTA